MFTFQNFPNLWVSPQNDVQMGPFPQPFDLLQEDGFYLLQEDGGKIQLEGEV